MKGLSWFDKLVFLGNMLVTVLTVVGYLLPFLAPKAFPFFSVFSLFLPFLLILNLLFFAYWGLRLKRQALLSGVLLLLGMTFVSKFYKFRETLLPETEKDFTVMSYNVRLFNLFKWIEGDIPANIRNFINEKNPDIVCLQEYSEGAKIDLKVYPHQYVMMQGEHVKTGQAILSKFPIIQKGKLELPNSNNNVIFADLRLGKDTVRVYSMHLQSVRITPDVDEINNDRIQGIDQKKRNLIIKRISEAFTVQQQQAEIISEHKKECHYPVILCGDMNNSAFSYVYRNIRGDLKDTFEEAGKGFGQTYNFKYYPARIDYIFADDRFKILEFKNYPDFVNSDHFPITTRLEFKSN